MSFFNPSEYSESDGYNSSYDTSYNTDYDTDYESEFEPEQYVNTSDYKGHKNTTEVDLKNFEKLCEKFRNYEDVKIKHLSGQDREDFDLVMSYVDMLQGTSYYPHLFQKMKKHFHDVESVKVGTVGSYFAGCLLSQDSKGVSSACSADCAGSMPNPGEVCDKAVVFGEKRPNGYSFSMVKEASSEQEMDPAYLFLESDFTGLSTEEKNELRSLGCKSVKLIGYTKDMKYSELYKTPKAIHEIKHRHVYETQNEGETGLILGVILLFLFLLGVLCYLIYR